MRTYAQFENKIVKGGRAYARNRSSPSRPAAPGAGCTRLWEQGRLPAHYEAQVVAEAGRNDLLEDTRLRDYLEARRLSASTGE